MGKTSLKFTTVFGFALLLIGLFLMIGGLFYNFNTLESAEIVFTGVIALSVGNGFLIARSLTGTLAVTLIGSLGVGYFIYIQTLNSWLWAIIGAGAFISFMLSIFKLRQQIRSSRSEWRD